PVSVVEVDRRAAELVRGEHRLEILRAVVGEDRDLGPPAETQAAQPRGEPRRAVVDLRPPEHTLPLDDGGSIGEGVSDRLPEVRPVLVHAPPPPTPPNGR